MYRTFRTLTTLNIQPNTVIFGIQQNMHWHGAAGDAVSQSTLTTKYRNIPFMNRTFSQWNKVTEYSVSDRNQPKWPNVFRQNILVGSIRPECRPKQYSVNHYRRGLNGFSIPGGALWWTFLLKSFPVVKFKVLQLYRNFLHPCLLEPPRLSMRSPSFTPSLLHFLPIHRAQTSVIKANYVISAAAAAAAWRFHLGARQLSK